VASGRFLVATKSSNEESLRGLPVSIGNDLLVPSPKASVGPGMASALAAGVFIGLAGDLLGVLIARNASRTSLNPLTSNSFSCATSFSSACPRSREKLIVEKLKRYKK
jgi:hypothetical protein